MFCVLQSPKCSRAGGGKETHRESARNCKFMVFVLINKVVVVASGELNVFAWWRLKKVRLFRRIVFTDTHLLKWPVVAWTTWSPEIGSECSAPTHNATHLFENSLCWLLSGSLQIVFLVFLQVRAEHGRMVSMYTATGSTQREFSEIIPPVWQISATSRVHSHCGN